MSDLLSSSAWRELGARICRSLLLVAVLAHAQTGLADDTKVQYRRGCVDGRFGQIHYHLAQPARAASTRVPIVLFHQNPRSAYEYESLLKELGRDRVAMAIDTPGYGESDRPTSSPTMTDLAGAMGDALDALEYGAANGRRGPVDAFGFHTGALVAAELAVARPDQVRRVVLSGIPLHPPEVRKARLASLPSAYVLDRARVEPPWQGIVVQRQDGVDFERAVWDFVQDLHSMGYWWYAYSAVWAYPIEERFALIRQPILILEPHEMDLRPTHEAHSTLLSRADYVEMPEIQKRSRVFDLGWPQYARELRAWLDRPVVQVRKN